jgi:hypothetical protein
MFDEDMGTGIPQDGDIWADQDTAWDRARVGHSAVCSGLLSVYFPCSVVWIMK